MLQHAFKEWAVICKALSLGKQSLVLRKGGIAEAQGDFQLEHKQFWLYPTYTHQSRSEIKVEAHSLFDLCEQDKPEDGKIRFSHFAEVLGIYRIHDLIPALLLDHLHIWSDQAVRKKFAYRSPGLFVLSLKVFQAANPVELKETMEYQGCKSWVKLDHGLPIDGATPVLGEKAMRDVQESLDLLLQPKAWV